MTFPALPDDLRALARKYRTLAEVHRALAAWDDAHAHRLDAALAEEFPGALRELQTLPLDELERRAEAIERAVAAGAGEPWMAWMAAFHALLRAALWLKPRLAGGVALDDEEAERLAIEAAARARLSVDAAFVRALARPPRGRIVDVVLARLAALAHTEPRVLADALFTRRRIAR